MRRTTVAIFLLIAIAGSAEAQIPRINTLFPIGAKAGTTVDVEVRGSGLDGANLMMVHGSGLTATVAPGGTKVDETFKPVWQGKCAGCHELRSPANRSMTPGQWTATVDRMIKVRSAPLSADESSKVTQYLVGAARAGRVTAQITVAPGAMPGLYEVRLATPRGVSSPCWFEVGSLPEVMAVNGARDQAQPVTLPCAVNGCFMATGERHFFKFAAKKGERSVFNLKAFRYNETNQFFFSPNLRLYDPSGLQIVENHGYFDMDPLIDWICPSDGNYTLEVRDLLGRPNPSSVYRLTMGRLPYDSVLSPPSAQIGTTVAVAVAGKATEGLSTNFTMTAPADAGIKIVPSPFGSQTFYASTFPVIRDDATGAGMKPAALPSAFTGVISKAGEVDSFSVQGSGTFEFDGYALRLGSPVTLSVSLVKSDGRSVTSFSNDGRMTAKLDEGQTYQLRVANSAGQGGPTMVYAIEANPARPGFDCVIRPDNITIRPGVSTAAMVTVARRRGIEGDITITAEDLPAGVTVSPVVLPQDRNIAWLQFTAAPGIAPLEKPIRVFATAHGPLGDVKVQVTPQEEFRLNNDPHYRNWSDVMLIVRGQPDFWVEAVNGKDPIRVHPRKATPVKLRIKRREGYSGRVTVYLSGLPLGWVAGAESTTGAEVTLNVRPDGNNTAPYLNRDPKWTPISATIEASSDEFRFAFGAILTKRVEVISDKDD